MPQIIFYIFLAIIAFILDRLVSPLNRGSLGSRYGYNNYEDNPSVLQLIANYIAKRNRRINALKQAEPHLKPYEKLFGNHTLSNKYCSLKLNAKDKKVVCMSKEYDENGNKMMVEGRYFHTIDIDEYFDTICQIFNYNTNYNNLLMSLENVAVKSVSIYMHKEEKVKPQTNTPKYDKNGEYIPQKEDIVEIKLKNNREVLDITNKIDINNASESELTALPGINIIMAKKIIDFRDKNRPFKSMDDFFKTMKIKPHFEAQLRDLICINKVNIKKYKKAKAERIIDI